MSGTQYTRSSRSKVSAQFATQRTMPSRALFFAQRKWSFRQTPLPARAISFAIALLVTVGLGLVHGEGSLRSAHAEGDVSTSRWLPKERAFHGALPESVIEMREEILAAIHAGDAADLIKAATWSQSKSGVPVDFGPDAAGDTEGYWKRISSDGKGAEVLAVAANLLALVPARLPIGKDPENTFVYVWPYLAELPPDGLSAAETVDLLRLVPHGTAEDMRKRGAWTWWRLAIAADGTWLVFRRYE